MAPNAPRARRGRLRAVCAVALVVAVGCDSGASTDTTPSPAAAPSDLAPLIVANGSEIARFVDGQRDVVHRFDDGDAAVALSGPDADGLIVQQRFDDRSNVVRITDDQVEAIAENAGLLASAVVDGSPTVVYATCNDATETEPEGEVVLYDVTSRERRKLTDACGPEYGVSSVSYGGGVFVASATSDLTEVFTFYAPDGTRVKGRPNPTDDLAYNEPPFLSDAVLTRDGSALAYLEAPDISGVTGAEQVRSGDFNVVVLDQGSGNETLRVVLPDPPTQYVRLDYDGRWLVVSRGPDEPVLVVDADADDPKPVDIGVEGVASIMRS